MKKLILFIIALMLIFASCKKEDDGEKLVVMKLALKYGSAKITYTMLPSKKDSVTYTKMNGNKVIIHGGEIYIDSLRTRDSIVTVKATDFHSEIGHLALNIFNTKADDNFILSWNTSEQDYQYFITEFSYDTPTHSRKIKVTELQ